MHRVGEKRSLLHSPGDVSDTPPKKKTCTREDITNQVSLKGLIKGVVQYFSCKLKAMFSTQNDQPKLQGYLPSTPESTISSHSSLSTSNYSGRPTTITSTPCADESSFHLSLSSSPVKDQTVQPPMSNRLVEKQYFNHQNTFPQARTAKFQTTVPQKTRPYSTAFAHKGMHTLLSVTPCSSFIAPMPHSSVTKLTPPSSLPPPANASTVLEHRHICDSVSRRDPRGTRATSISAVESPGYEAKYWTRWLQDFKGKHKHCQTEKQAVVQAARTKLQLSQKERMELEDKRVAQLRSGLSNIYLDSDDEEEEQKCRWTLTSEQMERVSGAINQRCGQETLSERYRMRISRRDLQTLTGLVWLNDEVINFYFNLISESCKDDQSLRVYVFNSFFYSKLSQSGYSGVRRWTKKVDLFSHDLILLPVHLGMHWCLAAIDFTSRQFQYYDSLLGTNPACLARLREYLKSESMDKKKSELNLSEWSDHTPQDIPCQTNSSDCGVFTCMYARHKAKQVPFNFSQDDMTDIRNHMIYEILEQTLL